MGGRIDCYMDITSLYSYIAFLELQKNQDLLRLHGVEVDIRPVLLGAINAGSGNRPPWVLPAKAVYGRYDAERSLARVGNPTVKFPEDLMASSNTVTPLRALHYIKKTYAHETFLTTMHWLFCHFWGPRSVNLTKPENVVKVLSEVPAGFRGDGKSVEPGKEKPLFSSNEVEVIMSAAKSQEMKDSLKSATQEALDQGAFGNPWLWVTNSAGHSEPFFGSDRFHFVYKFLGLPYLDVTLLPPGGGLVAHRPRL